ncbi:MAG TPA: alpha/beta fold hydrolase, partial [Acidobacteriota bacterium]|nr:alpha/beta fold hydrolase [Acidobacteriota bacterium]
ELFWQGGVRQKEVDRMKKYGILSKIFYILVILLVAAGVLEVLLFREVSNFRRPAKKEVSINPSTLLLNVNEIPFHTKDGIELRGWLIPGKPSYPAIIIAHDYGSDRSETLGKLEGLVSDLNKQGYFIFLFDFRGHGSSGSTSSLGLRESDDMEAALREVLKYRQIGRRIAVLGIGMGAIAASLACEKVDETKVVLLDSVYDDIPDRYTEAILSEWPAGNFMRPILLRAVDWNLRLALNIKDTNLHLRDHMPRLYHRPVVFVETTPPNPPARSLYDAAREPKEMLQLGETAADDLMGDSRTRYKEEIGKILKKYFPPVTDQQTMEIPK